MIMQHLVAPVSADLHHNAGAHFVLELFYGFLSLVVAFILFQEGRRYSNARLAFMAYAFVTMGILALAHAVASPGSVLFVWFHSLSALSGALLLGLSLLVGRIEWFRPASATPLAAVVIGTVLVAFLSIQFAEYLHVMLVNGGFSQAAVAMNLAAGVLFVLVGGAFLAEFLRSRETLFLVFSVVSLLLAQSEFMFPYSMLWDVNWWIWHGVRVGVVAVLIVMLAIEFVKGFRQLEIYHQRLLGAMQSIEDSNRRIQNDNQMLAAHAAILQDISQSLDTESVLHSILRAARRLPGVADVEILPVAERGMPGQSLGHDAQRAEPNFTDQSRRLVQPLVGRERVLGSIQVDYDSDYTPTEEDSVRLQVFANQAAVAMERARLHEELAKRHRHLKGMYETLRAVTSSIDLDRILDSLLQHESEVLEARYALAYLLSEDESRATVVAEYARDERPRFRGATCSVTSHPMLMTCVRERRSFHLALQEDGPEHFPETAIQAAVDEGEINEALYIPLIADGQVIGCIGLLLDAGSPLGRDELALARALAGQAGFAIHHGRLFRESQCSAEFRTGLGETMMSMIAARDLDAVVDVVCCGAVKLLNCSPALVCLIDDDTECLHGCVARHEGPNDLRRFERALRVGRRAHEAVAGSGAPVCLTPGSLEDLGLDGIEEELDNNAPILIAPFNVRGHMLGYMMLPVSMNGGERDFVERTMLFAQQAGLAIETAVLIKDLKQAFVALDNAQQSLVESERLASLGEMAASLSHEIRNPLGTVTSAVGLLQSEQLDGSERRELLELMESEVNRLNHLVSDTLDFARPARAREQCFELGPLIDQIVRMASVRFPDLVVEKELPEDLPDLTGEAAEIQQVLANLLDNAAAATQGKGAVLLRVRLEAEQVWFEILDSGPGIPHEMRNRVFEPFETTKPDGVGLGLVIVHRIVSNWGGTVDLESEPGNGTRVAFCLPLPRSPAMPKEVSYDG